MHTGRKRSTDGMRMRRGEEYLERDELRNVCTSLSDTIQGSASSLVASQISAMSRCGHAFLLQYSRYQTDRSTLCNKRTVTTPQACMYFPYVSSEVSTWRTPPKCHPSGNDDVPLTPQETAMLTISQPFVCLRQRVHGFPG